MDTRETRAPAPPGAGRARADGDARHFATFGLVVAALAVVVGAQDWTVRWFVGPPPQELKPAENHTLIREFCCRPDPTIEEIEPYVDRFRLGPREVPSDEELAAIAAATGQYVRTLDRVDERLRDLAKIAGLLMLGAIAARVAYRWRDMFMVLIPIYGPFFVAQMLWRITSPVPYWELPPQPSTLRRFVTHLVGSLLLFAVWVTIGTIVSDAVSPT